MTDDLLQIAISQTVDALSFSQTHEVDSDFRVHSKATMDTLRPLQAEQRNRIDQTFGPRPPSPNFLSTQLLACYRGEAASVQMLHSSGEPERTSTAVSAMSDAQCRAFKKELKQRIHEWEGSVMDVTGQSVVRQEQKVHLRSVYELYKTSKAKVLSTEANRDNSKNRSVTDAPSASGRPSEGGAPSVAVSASSRMGSTTLPQGGGGGGAGGSSSSQPRQAHTASSPGTRQRELRTPIPRVALGTMAPELLTDAELHVEKRRLKMTLLQFEQEFAKVYGEPANRHDRQMFSAEYTRYSDLKHELVRRNATASNGGSEAPKTP